MTQLVSEMKQSIDFDDINVKIRVIKLNFSILLETLQKRIGEVTQT